jgi:hypothetical protein
MKDSSLAFVLFYLKRDKKFWIGFVLGCILTGVML